MGKTGTRRFAIPVTLAPHNTSAAVLQTPSRTNGSRFKLCDCTCSDCVRGYCNLYPGGENPPNGPNHRKERAARVLQHYQANPPDRDTVLPLFIFGLCGLLPHLDFDLIDTHLPGLPDYLDQALRLGFPRFNLQDSRIDLYNIPPGHPFIEQYALKPALDDLVSFTKDTSNDTHQLATAFKFSPVLIHSPQPVDGADPRVYGLALVALCRAKHKLLQDMCVNIVDEQPIPNHPLVLIKRGDAAKNTGADAAKDAGSLLDQLCGALMASETSVAPVAILHFELLVARVVSSRAQPLKQLQSALRPLLNSHPEFTELKGSTALSLASLFSDLEKRRDEKRTRDDMLRMMQCVANFCDRGLSPDKIPEEGLEGGAKGTKQAEVNWYAKLVALKEYYKERTAKIERANLGAAASSSSNQGGAVDQNASAPLHGITPADPPVGNGATTHTG
ncbi:hypothetical protein FRC08_008993 [Ceratobasidium sp. 394]|nr:hypothetical protein FRC08_008993 [Ceratobasidium sp. 394]